MCAVCWNCRTPVKTDEKKGKQALTERNDKKVEWSNTCLAWWMFTGGFHCIFFSPPCLLFLPNSSPSSCLSLPSFPSFFLTGGQQPSWLLMRDRAFFYLCVCVCVCVCVTASEGERHRESVFVCMVRACVGILEECKARSRKENERER